MYCFECDTDSPEEATTCRVCRRPLNTDPDRYFRQGMKAMAAGDLERSIRLFRSCANLSPEHVSGRYNLGLALSLNNRCDEAMEHYQVIVERNPEHPGIFTALGQAAFGSYLYHIETAQAQRRSMVQFLMKAIEQDPDDVDALFSLANAYMAVGAADKALPWLKNALCLHPDSAAIYFTMANAFKLLNRHSEAVAMAKKALILSSSDDPFQEDIQELLSELQQGQLRL